MDGQVLGGGVIVLVSVLLWLVYLLPSWHSRYQYDAAERNAVRLNQAIRVLAETSDTPEEVRLELNARTALHQQRLAKRLQAQQEEVELADLRESIAVARAMPQARRARARRRARLTATVLLIAGLGVIGWGVWETVQTGSQTLLWAGAGLALLSVVVLHRMSRVAARSIARVVEATVERTPAEMQDVALAAPRQSVGWMPRSLPQPLVSAVGSRAAAEFDAAEARRELARAAREEALRARAEELAPTLAPTPVLISSFSKMGVVDDAEIEAHVRELLRSRVAG